MKRLIIAVPVILITLLAILVIAPSFIDWSVYKAQAQKQIKAIAGYDVALNGALSMAIIPAPRIYIEDVVVKAPEGSQAENLATLKRLEVSVALFPLFSGEVVISAVDLVAPDIALEVLKNGKPNWMTAELENMMGVKDAVPAEAKDKAGSAAVQAISLDNLSIEDGRFTYNAAGKVTEISDINVDVQAETLQGPFEVEGRLGFAGAPVEFKLSAGAMEQGAESIAVQTTANYNGIDIKYAGIVGLVAPFGVQGETVIGTRSLAKTAQKFGAKDVKLSDEGASLSGILTASPEKLEFKNASLDVAGNKFSADFSTKLSPLYVQGSFKAADTFNLDKIMPAGGGSSSGGDIAHITKMLPESLSLPMAFGADVQFALPSLIYNNQIFNGVNLALAKKDKSFQLKFNADQIPGKGAASLSADLNFAERSVSQKTGGEIYSAPSLSFALKGQTPDAPFTIKALSGQAAPVAFKAVSVDGSGFMKPGKLQINETAITLDGKSYKASGALEGQQILVNATAMGAQVMLKGDLVDGMKLSNTALQVRHPNLAKAIQDASNAPTQNAMLAKPVDFYTNINQEGTVYKLTDIKATLGTTAMSGALDYDGGAPKPTVSGALKFGDLVLQSAPASKAGGAAKASGASARWSNAPIDTAWMTLANIDLAIDANSIKYETWDLSKPRLKFVLKDGALNINDMGAGLYGGSVDLTGAVKPANGGGLSIEGQSKMTGIQMEPLVKSLAGDKLVKGQGKINMDVNINSAGNSHAALISALAGQGTIGGSAVVLEGIDINRFARALSEESKAGDSLLSLWKGTTSGGSTNFDSLDGAFTIQKGVVDLTKLDLDGPRGAIKTVGRVDLPKWTIATAHTMSVKDRDDVPPFTINISGSLDNPGQTFAQGAVQDYLQRKLSRKLEKVLTDQLSGGGKLDGKLGGALGGLLGLPTQQQAPANDNAAPQETQPSAGSDAGAPVQEEQPQQQAPSDEEVLQDAFQGLLKGLAR